jgi:murein DD-endopeptidase MepM/ murein hydrolase activator NlpD
MSRRRNVTIVVHVDGALASRQYRVPLWVVRAGAAGSVVVAVLVALFFLLAVPLTVLAGRVPALEREVARLRGENARVQRLAAALNRAEENYQALRQLLGGRAGAADEVRDDSPIGPMRAVAVRAAAPGAPRRYELGASVPSHWPLDAPGFVTRGQIGPGAPGEAHAGLDIAVVAGTPIRASGGGRVVAAGNDPDYGLFVRLRHPDGYETMYGHASRLLVPEGAEVRAGQVIALSGSSGRSTAPHLHFEISRNGRTVDPLSLVKEGT